MTENTFKKMYKNWYEFEKIRSKYFAIESLHLLNQLGWFKMKNILIIGATSSIAENVQKFGQVKK